MVIFQFVSTVIFLFCMLTTYKQFHFMVEKETGYQKENIVAINDFDFDMPLDRIRAELMKVPGVLGVTRSNQPIFKINNAQYAYWSAAPLDSALFYGLRGRPQFF